MTSELEAELEKLRFALDEKGAELRDIIREETQRKEAELQVSEHTDQGSLTWVRSQEDLVYKFLPFSVLPSDDIMFVVFITSHFH